MVALDFKKLASLFDKSGLQYQMDDFSVVVTTTLVDGEQIKIYCTLEEAEESFDIPRFFLEDDAFTRYHTYPHVNIDKSICAFNHSSSSVDPAMIEEAIVSVAIKSIDTLNNTIAGNCMDDFLDDLAVFWATAGTPLKPMRSFIDAWPDEATVVYMVELDDDKAGSSNGGIVKNYRSYKRIHRFTRYGVFLMPQKNSLTVYHDLPYSSRSMNRLFIRLSLIYEHGMNRFVAKRISWLIMRLISREMTAQSNQ